MAASELVVRDSRLADSHFRAGVIRFESQQHDRFEAIGSLRYPGMLNRVRPMDFDESTTMVRSAPNHGPPGLSGSVQTSETCSGGAGIARVTDISVRFIEISPFSGKELFQAVHAHVPESLVVEGPVCHLPQRASRELECVFAAMARASYKSCAFENPDMLTKPRQGIGND